MPEPGTPLSPTELRVLRSLAAGETYVSIAGDVQSQWTVKAIGYRLLRKLGAHTQAHAVAIGYAQGILTVADARNAA